MSTNNTNSTSTNNNDTKDKQMFTINNITIGEFVTPTIVKVTNISVESASAVETYLNTNTNAELFTRKDGVKFIRVKCTESMFVFLFQIAKDWGFQAIAKYVWSAIVEGCKEGWKVVVNFFNTLPETAKAKWAEFVYICNNLGNVSLADWMKVIANIIITVACAAIVIAYPTLAVTLLVTGWACGLWNYLSVFVHNNS
jgi:hypothetical protein